MNGAGKVDEKWEEKRVSKKKGEKRAKTKDEDKTRIKNILQIYKTKEKLQQGKDI